MTSPLPAIPPGPADTNHPRRALARLALSSAYREAADFAAGGVPTVSDEYGHPWDYVDHAARLVAIAQDVLARAVVYARERGGTWTTIAEALDTTAEQARDQYTATVDRWEDALDRPWERAGRFLSSRMPDSSARHQRDRDGAGRLPGPQGSGPGQAPSHRRPAMSHPNAPATWQAQAAAAHRRLRQIAALINEYDELADRTGNTDLAMLVFQVQVVLEDHHAEPLRTATTDPTRR